MEPRDIKFMQSLLREWKEFADNKCEFRVYHSCTNPERTSAICNMHTCPLGR